MDDLSPLFHDIEFKERFRGYDVEEVDAYIDRVAKAAALVQGRIAELQNRVAAAEAQPRTVVASSAPSEPAELDEESLTKMLLLAQRTADAAIEEAKVDAAEIRRQADEHASLVLAEAETDRRRMVAEAEAAVEETVRAERERVVAEVAELERYRAFLSDDIAILESHLEQSRAALASSVAALQSLVEAPEQFRTPAMPATSGVQVPAELVEHETADVDAAVVADEPELLEPVFEPIVEDTIEPEPMVEAPAFEIVDEVVAEPVVAQAPVEPAEFAEPIVEPAHEFAEFAEPEIAEPAGDPMLEVLHAESADAEVPAEPEPVLEVVEAEPADTDTPADTSFVFDPAPQGSELLWADDAAEAEALTFDPGPMPTTPPAPLPEPMVDEVPVVDLTDEPIVLDEPTAPTPIIDAGFVVDEPTTGEWNPSDTGTHTAIAPPLLVTAEDLEEAPAGDDDWIDDLRVEAGPVTEAMPTVDERLLFDEPSGAEDGDGFLEQLREAVNGERSEEFGEDALAAFFDDGGDDGGRTWFNRRR